MNKTVKVIINDTPYEVVVEDLSVLPVIVTVNGERYEVKFDTAQGSNTPLPVARPAAPISAPAAVKPQKAPTASTGSDKEIIAPMPGVILNISVKAGTKVSRGQLLCNLEAMKMKNAIRAISDGVISSVEVSDGQRVQYGHVLFKLE
jgi:biotin carboxyl carrier protein